MQGDLSKRLYSAEQVRALDSQIINSFSISGITLMERAARFAFDSLLERWPSVKKLIVFCGGGNNGGDGYLIAALAAQKQLTVKLIAVSSPSTLNADALTAFTIAGSAGLTAEPFSEDCINSVRQDDVVDDVVIVDAMLGTGINKPVEGDYALAIKLINEHPSPTLAVDIPSGLSSDTGRPLTTAIEADLTCTFIGKKLGQMTGLGRSFIGELKFNTLGAPSEAYETVSSAAYALSMSDLISEINTRPKHAHKGFYGHTLLIGGNTGYAGAIALAAQACARMGAGLTSVATHPSHANTVLTHCPEVMTKAVKHGSQLSELLSAASVIVIGPGLGRDAWSEQMLYHAILADKPMILDADALNILSIKSDWLTKRTAPTLMTPHPGEAARLLGSDTALVESDRLKSVRLLSEKYDASVVLKGSGTLIQKHRRATALCPYGNPGMASGGMGDVLSGILGGLWAQSEWSQAYATDLGVCLHAKAADIAMRKSGERGMLASDLIPIARQLLNRKETN